MEYEFKLLELLGTVRRKVTSVVLGTEVRKSRVDMKDQVQSL